MSQPQTEELASKFTSEFIDIESLIINVPTHNAQLEYSRDMKNSPKELLFILPEYSLYELTLKYKVKQRPLQKLSYHQVVRRAGIPFNIRDEKISDEAEVNTDDSPVHSVTFTPDDLPGGMLFRGTYTATSAFVENGKNLLEVGWKFQIGKKDVVPEFVGLKVAAA